MPRKLAMEFLYYGGLGGLIPLTHYFIGHFIYYKLKIPIVKQIFWYVNRVIEYGIMRVFFTSEIPAQCYIGKRLNLPHGAKGIVISKHSVIGDNVLIHHQVTIGTSNGKHRGSPRIGNNVIIGVGAKILGGITVGDNSKIGANSVVVDDIPPNSIAIGIPARVIKTRDFSNRSGFA